MSLSASISPSFLSADRHWPHWSKIALLFHCLAAAAAAQSNHREACYAAAVAATDGQQFIKCVCVCVCAVQYCTHTVADLHAQGNEMDGLSDCLRKKPKISAK